MTETIPVYIGFDPRQPVSFTTLVQSIINHSSMPVSIHPLVIQTLPIKRVGLTPFTYSRFLVPHLQNYRGRAIFLDADIMVRGDIAELWVIPSGIHAVSAVLHEGPLKFERASVMVFNCGMCAKLTPEYVEQASGLHTLDWAGDGVYSLPKKFNHLVGYDPPNPDAIIAHYTQGVPVYPETKGSEFEDEWMNTAQQSVSSISWEELMGHSVHAIPVRDRLSRANKGVEVP